MSKQSNESPWSTLPPMQLRGLNTPYVESLDHYLARLSQACASSPPKLLRRLALDCERSPPTWSSTLKSRQLVVELERLTSASHLCCGTFLTFEHAFDIPGTTRSLARRWCPVCYLNWDADRWEPLVWRISYLTRCPEHQTPIISRCRECGAPQGAHTAYPSRRRCKTCRTPLGFSVAPLKPTRIEEWIDGIVLELVGMCGDTEVPTVPRHNMTVLSDTVKTTRHRQARSWSMGMLRQHVLTNHYSWRSLKSVINLCALQSVRPRTLLLSPEEACSPVLFPEFESDDRLPISLFRRVKVDKVFEVIRRLTATPGSPLLPPELVLTFLKVDVVPPNRRSAIDEYRNVLKKQRPWPASVLARRVMVSALHLLDTRDRSTVPIAIGTAAEHISKLHGASVELARRALRAAIFLVTTRDRIYRLR